MQRKNDRNMMVSLDILLKYAPDSPIIRSNFTKKEVAAALKRLNPPKKKEKKEKKPRPLKTPKINPTKIAKPYIAQTKVKAIFGEMPTLSENTLINACIATHWSKDNNIEIIESNGALSMGYNYKTRKRFRREYITVSERDLYFLEEYLEISMTSLYHYLRYKTPNISGLEKRLYYYKVWMETEKWNICLPNIEKRGANFAIDHIVPISYGFKNNATPESIGHIDNLRIIPAMDNIIKNSTVDFVRYKDNFDRIEILSKVGKF